MKPLFLSLAFLALFAVPAIAEQDANAVADVEKQFDLRSSQQKTIDWAEANRKLIQETMHITVIEDMGKGKFKVKREYQGEEFIWIMQETIGTTTTGKYVYKAKLVESVAGGVVYSDTWLIISPTGNGSNVKIKMTAGVNNPTVSSRTLTFDFANRLNKCKKLMENHLD